MTIHKNLTAFNFHTGSISRIKHIVIHYTANNGDTAYGNTNYFLAYRGASAHYFVDEKEVWQSVEDHNAAWHCGTASTYKHASCRNSNSIGIELCSRKNASGAYYFKPKTVANAVLLTKQLMAAYQVPLKNVIRHYDVTGKICPAPFVNDGAEWKAFQLSAAKEDGIEAKKEAVEEEELELRYNNINEIPAWGTAIISKMIAAGAFSDMNALNLSEDMIRTYVFLERMGKL